MRLKIRRATLRDAPALVAFNSAMALETEGKVLVPHVIGAGVRGCSDWRNGDFWWIQSVYVRPEFRRRGVYRRLYRHLKALAAKQRAVCGYRTHYLVYEQLKAGIRFFTPAPKRR